MRSQVHLVTLRCFENGEDLLETLSDTDVIRVGRLDSADLGREIELLTDDVDMVRRIVYAHQGRSHMIAQQLP